MPGLWGGDTFAMDCDTPSAPRIMGILNVTPDSFSDGGRFADPEAAVAQARHMIAQGADIIDVGGESTRPGATRMSADEQIERVVEPIRRIRSLLEQEGPGRASDISIDTTLSGVAEAALDAGATMLNDVSAGREDPGMFALAAGRGVPIVLMHMLGEPATMQKNPRYGDVVAEVRQFLLDRAAAAEAAGVARGQIIVDPGIGFGKTVEHNLQLLAALPQLVGTGYRVLLGTSRKRFLGGLSCTGQVPAAAADRIGGTAATTALATAAGVSIIRVHDVAINRQAADVAAAITRHVRANRPNPQNL